jgi:SAM-dependent methyltransferase
MKIKVKNYFKKFIWIFYKPIKPLLNSFWDFNKAIKLKRKFNDDIELFNKLSKSNKALKEDIYACLYDATTLTEIESTYFYQDAWAFERIISQKPNNHIDIGSDNKFISLLSKITILTMIDIRPLSLKMDSINFIKGNILDLPFDNESIDSLSSLCVIEHIGLGRYGDEIDPYGSEKAFSEVNRVLKPGANFYFSVPIGAVNKVCFNAHRVFDEQYLLAELLTNFEILDKKYIYGNEFRDEKNISIFGVGCYHLKKIN